MSHRSLVLVSVAAALTGCAALDPDPTLKRFDGCPDMQQYLERMALEEAREAWSVGFELPLFGVEYDAMSFDAASGLAPPQDGPGAFSDTNTQELGIDEADLVETDGRFLYSLAGNNLVISSAWPVEDAMEVSRVALDGHPDGIYLHGHTVVALSTLWPGEEGVARSGAVFEARRDQPGLVITVVDASQPAAPLVTREAYVRGELRDSRRIDDRLYVVSYVDIGVDTWRYRTLPQLKDAVRSLAPDEWLPDRQDNVLTGGQWTTSTGEACGCEEVYASNRETGTLFSLALALDIDDPTSTFQGEGVVGRADVVYASANNLYLAYSETPDGIFRSLDEQIDTIVHQLDISSAPERPRYVDTVLLTGVLPDQFALDEYGGVLRAATTDTDGYTTQVHTVRVDPEDGMDPLDKLTGLARNEELYAARFVGDIGYLVTYVVATHQETVFDIEFGDPLFTIDLSDPEHIRDLGELVMNGWSDYIHPMDEDHLLTVGMDQDEQDRWRVAVSLFDVSDLRNPTLVDREILEALSSEAQQDHHAFNYFAPFQALAMPSVTPSGDRVLEVLHADPTEVRSLGRIAESASTSPGCDRIRRSVMLDDLVWAVAEGGLTAARLGAPEEILNTVTFDGIEDCDQGGHGYGYGYGYGTTVDY